MFSRYRSYTCYSEEDGKLVPSAEPSVKQQVQIETQQKPEPQKHETTQEKVEVK